MVLFVLESDGACTGLNVHSGRKSAVLVLGQAHIEMQATQPTQGRAAQVSVIHKFEYVSAS